MLSASAVLAGCGEMPLDRADRCGTPLDIATMALVVDGTIEVASRQTWTLRYLFAL